MVWIQALLALSFVAGILATPTPQYYAYHPQPQYHFVSPLHTPLGRQSSLPPIFPALNVGPPPEAPTITNPFRLPGLSVTLLDRNQLIDRLVTRLESLRVVPEGTPQSVPEYSASPSTSSATATTGENQDEGVRPLIAIANFIERVFQREPGFEDGSTSPDATLAGDEQATELDRVTGPLVTLNQAPTPEIVEEPVVEVAAEPTEEEKMKAKYAEAVAYRGGALLRSHDGELYYQKPYPKEGDADALELYLGRVHPSRPTVQSSFQQLLYGPQRVANTNAVLTGAPGYQNMLAQDPYWFLRRYF